MKPVEFLMTHSVFTRAELLAALQQEGHRSRHTATAHPVRWRKQGRILNVKQGVYVRVPQGVEPEKSPVDFRLLASRLAPDAVLGHHSALEVHGYAQSMFERFTFVTWTKTKPLRFRGREFLPVRPRAALAGCRDRQAWVETTERLGLELRVTTLERTVADVLDRPELAGGLDEVWRSCSAIPALDLKSLEAYVALLGIRTLAAKVGFFLEQRREELVVASALLERLSQRVPRGPVYMERRSLGPLVPRWNLLVPAYVLPPGGESETWPRKRRSSRPPAKQDSGRMSSRG